MTDFLPKTYTSVPKTTTGSYMKLQTGDNLIRILTPVVMGWLDWEEVDGKKSPIRTPYDEPMPKPLDPESPVKHFWAFVIWDYADEQIKIMEITQATIQDAILQLHSDIDWGNPTEYDIKINKQGEKLLTKYQVNPKPKKPIDAEVSAKFLKANIDLNKLFTNENPFGENRDESKDSESRDQAELDNHEISVSDLPF